MRRIISFMHISLDGFVAGPKGEMGWIKVDEEIFEHVGKRIRTGDTALYGRVTYEMMEGYWPAAGAKPGATKHDIEHSKWYNDVQKIVLSKTLKNGAKPDTTIISDNLTKHLNDIRKKPGDDILVFGSPTATHSLMRENLIDGYWLFINPIILGQGIRLFIDSPQKVKLNLTDSRSFANGVTEVSYIVDRS